MSQIVVPALGESVSEATVAKWLKKEGDAVKVDEPLVELETDKVTLEVNASEAGVLSKIAIQPGATVNVGAVLGEIAGGATSAAPAPASAPAPAANDTKSAPAAPAQNAGDTSGPAARKMMADGNINPSDVAATGKDGRLSLIHI